MTIILNKNKGPILTTGNPQAGEWYRIIARTDADFTNDGAPNNNVGTIFLATSGNETLDAGDKIRRLPTRKYGLINDIRPRE